MKTMAHATLPTNGAPYPTNGNPSCYQWKDERHWVFTQVREWINGRMP
jgi:hypothetical protein